MKTLFFILFLLLLNACNGKGGAFSGLEDKPVDPNNTDAPIVIESYTPTADPVVVIGSANTTFALAVNGDSGVVTYDFILDNITTLQSSQNPFYTLSGSSLTAGVHTFKAVATNSVSTASQAFNLRKNSAPAILSSSPSLAGNTVNCDDGTLTLNALTADADGDSYTQSWILDGVAVTGTTAGVVVTNGVGAAQLAYTPACAVAGFHTITLRLYDGYEYLDQTWSVGVANPAVETIISYFPTSNNITYLSTDASKTFNVTGSGVGSLTFVWKLDGSTLFTNTSVTTSNYNLLATAMTVGTHTLQVVLTDSSATNDPALPVKREWTIYKNQKPRILSPSPSSDKAINLNTPLAITANIEDALDTFTTTITKGALSCSTPSTCGLSGVVLPTTTNSFSSTFTPGSTFLGQNVFTLSVTDSYGETDTKVFNITANYFSNYCNDLDAGEICTLIGLPGLGSGTNIQTSANRVRISPNRMILDERGNVFFTDHTSNTVWYYNRTSSAVSLLNVNVPAYSIYVVAGTGVTGSGGNGQLARKVAMNFNQWGGGLAWDSSRQELFIADYSNSRVLRIDSTGRAYVVCGGGALTAQGAIAKNSRCTNPSDLAYDNTNRRLYIAQLNDHIIKVVDTSDADFNNWPSYILAGVYASNATTAGSINLTSFYTTTAGISRLSQPLGLHLDVGDQILYYSQYSNCRIGAIGLPGSTSRSLAGTTINSLNNYVMLGSACGNHVLNSNVTAATNLSSRPTDLWVNRSGANVLGVYFTNHDGHRVMYYNNTAGTVSIGGQSITTQRANNVFGNGTTNAPTNPPSGINSAVYRPFSMVLDGNAVYVAARDGNIIQNLDISTGSVGSLIGGTGRAGYSGNSALDSILVTLNNPFSLLYKDQGGIGIDPIPGNTLFIADSSNAMIRSVNLTTGRVEDFIGTGSSAVETLSNTVSTATRIRGSTSMGMYNGFFLYNDANNNCFTRAYNPFSSDQSVFSTLVNLNKTNSVAGNVNSCGDFVGSAQLNTTDLNAKMNNPWGLGVDEAGGKIYVSSTSSHCILKITDGGTMVPFIGTCGTIAGSPLYGGIYNDPSMLLRAPGEIIMDPMSGNEGNFFFIDWSDQGTAHIKYVNLVNNTPVDFFGGSISILKNNIDTVLAAASSPGYIRGLAVFENWVCYSSGTGTNGNNTINCRDRSTGDAKTFGVAGVGGIQLEFEHEGASVTSGASTVTFAIPTGLTFDSEGNLYVGEQGAHVIRKIKRWFP